ncbi:MAG: AlkZ family DNA glycosylase, partial [Verrucomicrobia bacterium]|nr:AlkZ family DNA glycosylase [Verrucomicrobiota bacterium]
LRSTLHFTAAADVHWLLELTAPRILSTASLRFERYGLDTAVLARIRKLLVKTLQGSQQLTRDEIYAVLQRARISVEGQRGYHILWRMGVDRIICFGTRRGKQTTFTLLEEWAPRGRKLDRDTALAELTRRYFVGHGPATLQDFVWWSGLKVSDAKAGLAMAKSRLESLNLNDQVYWLSPETPSLSKAAPMIYLLPGFDELLLGYRDRSASLDPVYRQKVQAGSNGIFLGTIVVNGRVIGTWKRELRKSAARVTTSAFRPLTRAETDGLEKAIGRYCEFLELKRTQ